MANTGSCHLGLRVAKTLLNIQNIKFLYREHVRNNSNWMQDKTQTLARPATPLAACVQRISCSFYRKLTPSTECHRNLVIRIKQTKIGCHGNVLEGWEN